MTNRIATHSHVSKKSWVALVALALTAGSVFAEPAAVNPPAAPAVKQAAANAAANKVEPADQPFPKVDKDNKPQATFMKMHESFLKRGKEGKIGLLFLGDSITQGWGGKGKEVYAKAYSSYDPANFGIGGDRTQNVLWRIANGELDGISPKVLVLMIGTNNTGGNSADEIAKADIKIISEIHQKLPNTKVLVLGVFPRGADPKEPKVAAVREKIKKINAELAKLDDGGKTRYLDIGDKFLTPDGVITKEIMSDALHPGAKGYQIWVDAMQPLLDEMWK